MRIATGHPETLPVYAHFRPMDRVRFRKRGDWVDGVVVACNLKSADVQIGGSNDLRENWRVDWAGLRPADAASEEACRHRVRRSGRLALRAVALMQRHGLDGWQFRWDMAQRRGGACNFRQRAIQLSLGYAMSASDTEVEDTILHEIAHALVGPGHGHDAAWRAVAASIGCSGRVTHDLDFSKARWEGRCPNGCARAQRIRRKRNMVCRQCGGAIRWHHIQPGELDE